MEGEREGGNYDIISDKGYGHLKWHYQISSRELNKFMQRSILSNATVQWTFAFDVTHEFWGGNFKNGITSPS